MKVFLCWSGERSRKVAEMFKEWLPQMIQVVEPWMSPDIEKGDRWNNEIAKQLEESKIGIVCLTKENLNSRWILFESGALSKTKDSRPCTFLLDVKSSDVEPPLSQFQHTQFNKDDLWQLLTTINKKVENKGENAPSEKVLVSLFNTLLPQFEKDLQELAEQEIETQNSKRDQTEILEEILQLVRAQSRQPERFVIFDTSGESRHVEREVMAETLTENVFVEISNIFREYGIRAPISTIIHSVNRVKI